MVRLSMASRHMRWRPGGVPVVARRNLRTGLWVVQLWRPSHLVERFYHFIAGVSRTCVSFPTPFPWLRPRRFNGHLFDLSGVKPSPSCVRRRMRCTITWM